MRSDMGTLPVSTKGTESVTIAIHPGVQVSVMPLHRGHHPVWATARYRVDICNMVDDVVVRDLNTGFLYRFPIVDDLLRWIESLIWAMNRHDQSSGSPWLEHNVEVRDLIMQAALRRLRGDSRLLNIFEPGLIAPAINDGELTEADRLLAAIIAERPQDLVEE